ncbi:DUF933 domain-containing protein [Methylocystis parvus]|uniref:DUF933 domain-containing protein n=1 Tax=Methylocystis parvus TaxID=134 RepID=UPI003C73306A
MRRHRPCRALLRGWRRDPCRGRRRSDPRHRDDRDRADARRSRKPRKARRAAREEGQGRRQGGQGAGRPHEPLPRAAARGQARAHGAGLGRRAQDLRGAGPAVVEAGPLRLQRRGSFGGQRQCLFEAGRSSAPSEERGGVVVIGQDRERDRGDAGRGAEGFSGGVGLDEPGLNRVIRAGYELLRLITYFTVGPKEARAWTIEKGTRAPAAQAATRISGHPPKPSTSKKASFAPKPSRDAGRLRLEGKEYVVADGDVMHFRFNT